MTDPNRPARLNRTLLALLGLLLVLTGATAVALGTGLLAGLLPALDPTGPVLPADPVLADWTPYAAAGAAALLALLCLRWLVAQIPYRPRTGMWALPTASGAGSTALDADRAADAVGADITGYPGVADATATLTGTAESPVLHLVVDTETGACVGALRDRIAAHAAPRLRDALDVDAVATHLLVRVDAARVRRVR